MVLNVVIDDRELRIDVPSDVLESASEIFDKMDRDMDRGWQMSREYIEHPEAMMRGQIVASKLLAAIEAENKTMALVMAGYIVSRLPQVGTVRIATNGEMQDTELIAR